MSEITTHTPNSPVGPAWHDSLQKRQQDIIFVRCLRPFTIPVAARAVLLLSKHGYYPFSQERVGKDGNLFLLPKMQVMDAQDVPLENKKENHLSVPVAKLIDSLSIDAFLELQQVSTDPDVEGNLSVFGGPRAKLPEEYRRIERFMTTETTDNYGNVSTPTAEDITLYDEWCATEPKIRRAIWGTTSNLRFTHQAGTFGYTKELIQREVDYFHSGSQMTDFAIFYGLLAQGSRALQSEPLG